MAANHVAIMRGSARIAHQKTSTDQSNKGATSSSGENNNALPTSQPDEVEQSINELSQMSVISISSGEDNRDLAHELSLRLPQPSIGYHGSPSTSASGSKTVVAPLKPLMAPIERLDTIEDLEACVESDTALDHLQECSDQVTEASLACSQSLADSIEMTCDKVDAEMKALYQLIAKCDELVTKLSVAGSFRDEIKTLKKSIETLEQFHKSSPSIIISQ